MSERNPAEDAYLARKKKEMTGVHEAKRTADFIKKPGKKGVEKFVKKRHYKADERGRRGEEERRRCFLGDLGKVQIEEGLAMPVPKTAEVQTPRSFRFLRPMPKPKYKPEFGSKVVDARSPRPQSEVAKTSEYPWPTEPESSGMSRWELKAELERRDEVRPSQGKGKMNRAFRPRG